MRSNYMAGYKDTVIPATDWVKEPQTVFLKDDHLRYDVIVVHDEHGMSLIRFDKVLDSCGSSGKHIQNNTTI